MSSQVEGPLEYTYAQANSAVDATLFRREFSGATLFARAEFGSDNFTVYLATDAAALSPPIRAVSEYMLLFWVFCFIINAFTQPSGTVAAAARSQGCGAAVLPADEGPRMAASLIMNERLPRGTAEQTKDSLKEVKGDASKRITAFMLGVAPSFAKLLGCTISSYFKALGACYVVPWILFELLLVLANPDADINWGGDNAREFPAFGAGYLRRKLGKGAAIIQAILLALPFVLHAVGVISARLELKGYLGEIGLAEVGSYQACLVFSVISAFIGPLLGFGAIVLESNAGTPRLSQAMDRHLWPVIVITGSIYINLAFILDNVILTAMELNIESDFSPALHALNISLSTGGAVLMLIPVAAQDRKWQLDLATYLQVLYGFVALLTSVLVLYDSAGTVQPDWVDYLGRALHDCKIR